jgi:ABC-type transporter Mla subunit MlaD
MTFVQETQHKITHVASKIEKVNPSAAARLMRLNSAIGHAPDSMPEAWAATNVQQMIDVHTIAAQMRAKDSPSLILRFFEWVRNLLIFLPLALTWYGIASAVSAYSSYINAAQHDPHLDSAHLAQIVQTPFLYLWQQGFGGYLSQGLTLSNLALFDFGLLSLLLILTAIVNSRTHLRSSAKEQEVELLQEELSDALADAALCLTTTRGQQPTNVADLSRQLLDELAKERQRLDELSRRREKELADLKSFTDALLPIAQNMRDGAAHIQQSTDSLTGVLQGLSAPLKQLVDDTRSMLTTLAQVLQEQRSASESVKELVAEQKNWSSDLEQAMDELSIATRSLNQLPASINQWTGQLAGLVNQLTVEHQAQTTISQMTADAAAGLQNALQAIHHTSNELRSMANDFFTIMNTQKDFPNAVKASLNDVIRDYSNAAATLAQSGNNLAYASQMLMNATNRLNGGGQVPMHP